MRLKWLQTRHHKCRFRTSWDNLLTIYIFAAYVALSTRSCRLGLVQRNNSSISRCLNLYSIAKCSAKVSGSRSILAVRYLWSNCDWKKEHTARLVVTRLVECTVRFLLPVYSFAIIFCIWCSLCATRIRPFSKHSQPQSSWTSASHYEYNP